MMLSFRSILWLMPLCHATVPAECDGDDKFPTLSFAYTLQWDMLDWNRSDGRITSSSGSAIFIKLLQRNELFVDDPHGRVMWMGIGSGPDAEYYVCGFDANNKQVFECAHRGLDYLMVFDIVDFVAGACEVDTFEFVGVRGTMDSEPIVDSTSNSNDRIFLETTNVAFAGRGYRFTGLSLVSQPNYQRQNRWMRWKQKINWQRRYYAGRHDGSTTLTTTGSAGSCAFPKLPQVPIMGSGTVEWVSCRNTFSTSGSWQFQQYDGNAQVSPEGQFLFATASLFNSSGGALPEQRNLCVLRRGANVAICANQYLDVFGSLAFGDFQDDCEPRGIQYVGQFRYSIITCYGPSWFATEAFEDTVTDPSCGGAGFPKFLQSYSCNLTALGSDSFGGITGFVTQDFFELTFQGSLSGSQEGGRLVRQYNFGNETSYCVFHDADSLSCIFGETCLVIRAEGLTLDSDCNVESFSFVGSSGGWCSPEQPDSFGSVSPRFYDAPPAALQWVGNCAEEEDVTQFEALVCWCTGQRGTERPCGWPFILEDHYRALAIQDCQNRFGLDESCCTGLSSLLSYPATDADCVAYQTIKNAVQQNGNGVCPTLF